MCTDIQKHTGTLSKENLICNTLQLDILCIFREKLWMALGLFQEALGAMFALINEMEMAIRINTLIIFGNSAELHEGSA